MYCSKSKSLLDISLIINYPTLRITFYEKSIFGNPNVKEI